jgi:hypothetical protein
LVVHAFFGSQPWNGRPFTTDADLVEQGAVPRETNSFSKETPSLKAFGLGPSGTTTTHRMQFARRRTWFDSVRFVSQTYSNW